MRTVVIVAVWLGTCGASSEFKEYEKAQQEAIEEFTEQQEQAFEDFYQEQKKAFEAFSHSEDGVINRINPYQEKDVLPAEPLIIPSKPLAALPISPEPEPAEAPEPCDIVPEEKPAHEEEVGAEEEIKEEEEAEAEAKVEAEVEVEEEAVSRPEPEAPPPVVERSEVVGDDLRLNYFGTGILLRSIGKAKLDGSFEELDSSPIAQEAKRRDVSLVPELARARREHGLNDWDTVVLIRQLVNTLYTPSQLKLKTVQAIDLLRGLGYRCRLGRVDQAPVVLLAVAQELFYKSFLTIEGERYYIFRMDRHARMNPEGLVYLSTSPEDGVGMPVDMSMRKMQRLGIRGRNRTLVWDFKGKEYSITVQVNGMLLDLMDEYPQVDLSVYFQSGTYRGASMDMVGQISALLEQESFTEEERINFLLRFVQKAFEYKTDQDAYGYERPLFVEQSLGLPYLDCEDRSVLLSALYRNVLRLDTIGLDYPLHVSLGVHVPVPMDGDSYEYRSKRYLVADPAYLYANAGESQPKYKNAPAEVIETDHKVVDKRK